MPTTHVENFFGASPPKAALIITAKTKIWTRRYPFRPILTLNRTQYVPEGEQHGVPIIVHFINGARIELREDVKCLDGSDLTPDEARAVIVELIDLIRNQQ
ncbi:MAG: hypothetical protein ACYCQK_01360 [Acidiferrobacteraceae bacterium]